jgi:hypothetical protein
MMACTTSFSSRRSGEGSALRVRLPLIAVEVPESAVGRLNRRKKDVIGEFSDVPLEGILK